MPEVEYKSPRSGRVYLFRWENKAAQLTQEDYDTFARKIEQIETGTEQSAWGAFGSGLGQGITTMPGTALQQFGSLTGINVFEETGKYSAEQARKDFPIDPLRREDFTTQVGQSVGPLMTILILPFLFRKKIKDWYSNSAQSRQEARKRLLSLKDKIGMKKQEVAIAISAVVFIISILFVPWEITVKRGSSVQRSNTVLAPLWAAPSVDYGTARLRVDVLLLEWAALMMISGFTIFLLRMSGTSRPPKAETKWAGADPNGSYGFTKSIEIETDLQEGTHLQNESRNRSDKSHQNKIDDGYGNLGRWTLFGLIAYSAAFYIQHLGRVSGANPVTAPGLIFAQTTGSALSLVFLSVLISLPFRKQRRFTVRFWSVFIMSFFAIIGAKDSNTKNPPGDNAPPTNGISSPEIPQPTIANPSHTTTADTIEEPPSGETKVVIGVVPAVMQYDKKEFSVKVGDKVSILFTNKGCPLQHNLVILKPGTDAKFGMAADKMIVADAAGAMAKVYLPDDAESKASIVAASTKLIGTGQNEILTFTAPAEAGAYPFLCTFPGHRFLMKGVMTVTQ